jgi:hypothetical protein
MEGKMLEKNPRKKNEKKKTNFLRERKKKLETCVWKVVKEEE